MRKAVALFRMRNFCFFRMRNFGGSMRCRAWVVAVLGLLVCVQSAWATSNAEPGYETFQEAMGGVVDNWATRQGYSLSDPRVMNTLAAMGAAAAASAGATEVGAGLLIGSAPAWGTVLGVAALGAGAAAIALDGKQLYSWLFSGTPTSPSIAVTEPATSTPVSGVVTEPVGTTYNECNFIIANSVNQAFTVITAISSTQFNEYTYFSTTAFSNPNSAVYTSHSGPYTCGSASYYVWQSTLTTLTSACPAGETQSGTSCVSGASGGTTTVTGQTLTQAVAGLSSTESSTQLSDTALQTMANYLLAQAAAQAGYQGLPYSASTPVSLGDIDSWLAEYPADAPTVGDLGVTVPSTSSFMPSTSSTTVTDPATPASVTSTSPCVADADTAGCASLGSASAPSLASSAVAVQMSPWSIGPTSGSCPAPETFTVFGTTISIPFEPLCSFATTIQPLIVACCALFAAFIVVGGLK